ncbi:Carboxylesterase [Hibiscus syriacus]|uniref:Carboxylesterase n=1 Tax=Hibiscus syriacus TaxID=106335 RepID=A0A6A2ZY14_HIBSY|nr:Carboxylesterase [Hibiscus syriacus]
MKKLYRRGTVHPSPPITTDHLSFLPATILTLAAALSLEDGKCYMSYWVRWNSSPNRQLIHEIIDAFEDGLAQSKKTRSKKDRKKKNGGDGSGGLKRVDLSLRKDEWSELKSVETSSSSCSGEVRGDDGEEEGTEKGTVRRFVNFIGERIWNVWGSEFWRESKKRVESKVVLGVQNKGKSVVEVCRRGDDLKARVLLYLIGIFLCPTGDMSTNKDNMKLICDEGLKGEFNWAKYVHSRLIESIITFQKGIQRCLKGCIAILKVELFDFWSGCDSLSAYERNGVTRIHAWGKEEVVRVMAKLKLDRPRKLEMVIVKEVEEAEEAEEAVEKEE